MNSRISILAVAMALLGMTFSCDDEVTSMGSSMMPDQDSLTTYFESFPIITRTVQSDSVVANTSSCYIGSIVDPETRATTTCSFLAQFHLQEDYLLPDVSTIVKDENGNVIADSCVVRIFHDKFYGDSLTTMKLNVKDLRLDNVMQEGMTYYTNLDPKVYVNPTPKVNKTVTYSVLDQNLPADETSLSSGNYRSVPVHLGADYGTYILQSYYKHPEYFKNSYTFSHNVCPGIYVEHTGGVGALINSDVSVLDVYFRYYDEENDSIMKAWMRLGATQEVIQNTRYSHEIPEEMLQTDNEHPYTYIKSPSALHTEVTLPIKEMLSGRHYNDTINSARFTLRRYAVKNQSTYDLEVPAYIVMLPKGKANEFFSNGELPDSKTSYLTQFSSTQNCYTFSNVAPLLAYFRKTRDSESGVLDSDDEVTRESKWSVWEAAHPDWQTFELYPVSAEYYTQSSSYSYYYTTSSSSTLLGIRNDFNLHSVKLEGSPNGEVEMNVIYSRFEK